MMDRKDIIKRYKWLCGKAYKSGVLYVDLDYCPYEKSFSNEDIEKMSDELEDNLNKHYKTESAAVREKKTMKWYGMDGSIVEEEAEEEELFIPASHEYVKFTLTNNFNDHLIPERVIFAPPATIVFWKDGTKTVVKTSSEDFDPEKGLAMATMRKIYSSRNAFMKALHGAEWQLEEENVSVTEELMRIANIIIGGSDDAHSIIN